MDRKISFCVKYELTFRLGFVFIHSLAVRCKDKHHFWLKEVNYILTLQGELILHFINRTVLRALI